MPLRLEDQLGDVLAGLLIFPKGSEERREIVVRQYRKTGPVLAGGLEPQHLPTDVVQIGDGPPGVIPLDGQTAQLRPSEQFARAGRQR